MSYSLRGHSKCAPFRVTWPLFVASELVCPGGYGAIWRLWKKQPALVFLVWKVVNIKKSHFSFLTETQKIIQINLTYLLFPFGPPQLPKRLAWKRGVCTCWAEGWVVARIVTFRHWFGLNDEFISLLTESPIFPVVSWFTRQFISSGEPIILRKRLIASSDWLPAIAAILMETWLFALSGELQNPLRLVPNFKIRPGWTTNTICKQM